MKKKKTFEEWMQEVDKEVQRRVFLSIQDLPDCPFRDWYEDGVTPKGAASRVIKNANE